MAVHVDHEGDDRLPFEQADGQRPGELTDPVDALADLLLVALVPAVERPLVDLPARLPRVARAELGGRGAGRGPRDGARLGGGAAPFSERDRLGRGRPREVGDPRVQLARGRPLRAIVGRAAGRLDVEAAPSRLGVERAHGVGRARVRIDARGERRRLGRRRRSGRRGARPPAPPPAPDRPPGSAPRLARAWAHGFRPNRRSRRPLLDESPAARRAGQHPEPRRLRLCGTVREARTQRRTVEPLGGNRRRPAGKPAVRGRRQAIATVRVGGGARSAIGLSRSPAGASQGRAAGGETSTGSSSAPISSVVTSTGTARVASDTAAAAGSGDAPVSGLWMP